MVKIINYEFDEPAAEFVVEIEGHEIIINCFVEVSRRAIRLYNFHLHGPGANQLGVRGLYEIGRAALDFFDVDEIEIQGYRRTTGARPGHVPRPIRFRRRTRA